MAYSTGRGEGVIDVEEADGVLYRTLSQRGVDAACCCHDCGFGC